MLFFRSEEHLKNWAQYEESNHEGIIPLNDLVRMFSGNYFKRRMDSDYVAKMGSYMREMIGDLHKLEGAGKFFKL
jgi:hypothetical protein